MPSDDRGKHWCDAAVSQGMSRIDGYHRNQEEAGEGGGSMALLTPRFGLFLLFKAVQFPVLVTVALENQYRI